MLSKEVENLIGEFILMDNKTKFKRKYICYFSNGSSANGWFKKHQDEILTSLDERCETVRKQYQEYKDRQDRQRLNYSIGYHIMLFSGTSALKEFAQIDDNSKYEPCCNICLSNGVNAYDFFLEKIEKIMSYEDPLYKSIRKDYLLYKSKKQKLNYKKTLLAFYKQSGYGKFDKESNVKLSNGVDAGIWFNEFKYFILDNKGPIEAKIIEQYKLFLIHYDLAKEFLEKEDLRKFDFDSNVRFISHALMNLWWEDNEKKIKYSDLNIDELIIEQYEQYIKEKKL